LGAAKKTRKSDRAWHICHQLFPAKRVSMRLKYLAPMLCGAVFLGCVQAAHAQFGPPGPPAVGVVAAKPEQVTETSEFVGRVQAVDTVALAARVTAFLTARLFTEGAEVQQGQLLYTLERGPFEASVAAARASVAQNQALLTNATLTLSRAQSLLNTPAGQRSTVDDALATQQSQAAQLASAKANLDAAAINLAYTEIRAPIAGKIGRSTYSVGNVVSPSSGALATIVSQDPMYVLFPVATREALDLRDKYASQGGFSAVNVRVRLPSGKLYGQVGKVNYIDPTVSQTTDTLTLRASIPNPLLPGAKPGDPGNRELSDGEFVTVLVEGVQPVTVLGVPRQAVLSDQQGSYVYVVDATKHVSIRRVTLGQSTEAIAAISAGVKPGEDVVVDGLQRVRPGIEVNPHPFAPPPAQH
jgi:membrane fusion protein (multidrug efflux system)